MRLQPAELLIRYILMIIAVSNSGDELSSFVYFKVERNEVKEREEVRSAPGGCDALLKQLVNLECDLLICSRIPKELETVLNEGGINLITGIAGNPDAVLKSYLNGTLDF